MSTLEFHVLVVWPMDDVHEPRILRVNANSPETAMLLCNRHAKQHLPTGFTHLHVHRTHADACDHLEAELTKRLFDC